MCATNNEENVYLIGRFHSLTKQVTTIKVSKKYSFLIKFRLQVRTVLLKETPNNSGKMMAVRKGAGDKLHAQHAFRMKTYLSGNTKHGEHEEH